MSNYGVQIGNLSTQEMPCLFLSTIFDINLVTAKNGYKSISSVEMYSKLNYKGGDSAKQIPPKSRFFSHYLYIYI